MRAAAFIAGTVIAVGLFLAVAAVAGFGAKAIGGGSLAILMVAAATFVMSEPRKAGPNVTRVARES